LAREELARIVFSDPAARQKLEAITHPRIHELWANQVQVWRAQNKPLAFVVIPLLYETSAEGEFDAVICVACSAATQAKRLQERGWAGDQIAQRIAAQLSIEKKIARADYVAWNEGSLGVLAEQLKRIIEQ
jgi:dephospho-CoA kinase